MSTTIGRDGSKSEFARQVLFDDEHANTARINELWNQSGQEGGISVSLVNKLRSEMGLTGNLRRGPKAGTKKQGPKPRKTEPAAATAGAPSPFRGRNARANRLTDVEADIDRLLFKVMAVDGLDEAAEALRQARRMVYRAMS